MPLGLSKAGALGHVPIFTLLVAGLIACVAWLVNSKHPIKQFLAVPGSISWGLLLLFVVFNWKSMPFVWTYRVLSSIFYHSVFYKSPSIGPKALFKPIIVPTYTPLLEIDYFLHKSNSTYFADLDVARAHLISYLFRTAFHRLSKNAEFRIVLDPMTGSPLNGQLGIHLGAVECSFKHEVPLYKPFEMWSRVLAWDRKWLYIVTHFVPKGIVQPTEWLDPQFKMQERRLAGTSGGGTKKIYATAISKYVFKLERFTVHPSIVLEQAGLLPERPDGWMSGDQDLGVLTKDILDIDFTQNGDEEWDWRRIEAKRRKGMELASQFHNLDQLQDEFDGGNRGVLGTFGS